MPLAVSAVIHRARDMDSMLQPDVGVAPEALQRIVLAYRVPAGARENLLRGDLLNSIECFVRHQRAFGRLVSELHEASRGNADDGPKSRYQDLQVRAAVDADFCAGDRRPRAVRGLRSAWIPLCPRSFRRRSIPAGRS